LSRCNWSNQSHKTTANTPSNESTTVTLDSSQFC
jgi:hypothetical protein